MIFKICDVRIVLFTDAILQSGKSVMEPSLSLSPGFLHSFALKEAAAPLGQNKAGGVGWGGSKGRNMKSSAGAGMLGAGG